MDRIPRWFWWLLALALALGVRFYALGQTPLNDDEARLALQALSIAEGRNLAQTPATPLLLNSQVLYLHLTAPLFFLFGAADALARFWPALAGSLLVLLPLFFRQQLGERGALFLAFFIALDGGMIALSRQANALMPLLLTIGLSYLLWQSGRDTAAGIFAGLSLLAGRPLWEGALLLLIGLLFGLEPFPRPSFTTIPWSRLSRFSLGLGSSLLLGGTLFLFSPSGLGALWNGPVELFQAWGGSGVPPIQLLLVLLGYEALPLFLALYLIGRKQTSRQTLLWLELLFFLPLLPPGRTPLSWVWFILTLLVLAARGLEALLAEWPGVSWPFALASTVSAVLLTFITIQLVGLATTPTASTPVNWLGLTLLPLRHLAILGALLLLIASLMLIALEWTWKAVRPALLFSLSGLLAIYTLGGSWSATGQRYPDGIELWSASWPPLQAALLRQTMADLSRWHQGHFQAEAINLVGPSASAPSYRWLLRERPQHLAQGLSSSAGLTLILSDLNAPTTLTLTHRGQDFAGRPRPNWTIGSSEVLYWLFFRRLPLEQETVILWADAAIFNFKSLNP